MFRSLINSLDSSLDSSSDVVVDNFPHENLMDVIDVGDGNATASSRSKSQPLPIIATSAPPPVHVPAILTTNATANVKLQSTARSTPPRASSAASLSSMDSSVTPTKPSRVAMAAIAASASTPNVSPIAPKVVSHTEMRYLMDCAHPRSHLRSALNKQLLALTNENRDLRSELKSQQTSTDVQRRRADELERRAATTQPAIAAVQSELESACAKISTLEASMRDINARSAAVTSERDTALAAIQSVRSELAASNDAQSRQRLASERELALTTQRARDLQSRIDELTSTLAIETERHRSLQSDMLDASANANDNLTSRAIIDRDAALESLASWRVRAQSAASEATELRTQIEDIERRAASAAADALRELQESRSRLLSLTQARDDAITAASTAALRVGDERARADTLQAQLDAALADNAARALAASGALESELRAEYQRRLADVDTRLEQAEQAAADRLSAVSSAAEAAACDQFLERVQKLELALHDAQQSCEVAKSDALMSASKAARAEERVQKLTSQIAEMKAISDRDAGIREMYEQQQQAANALSDELQRARSAIVVERDRSTVLTSQLEQLRADLLSTTSNDTNSTTTSTSSTSFSTSQFATILSNVRAQLLLYWPIVLLTVLALVTFSFINTSRRAE